MKSINDEKVKAALVTKDGLFFFANGFGAEGEVSGEIVFDTGMIGYQEAITNPNYSDKIVNFVFPHIGNVGINDEDAVAKKVYASGLIVRNYPTESSNWRTTQEFADCLKSQNVVGIWGIDTRALVKKIRNSKGGLYGIIAYDEKGLDIDALKKKASEIQEKECSDLPLEASSKEESYNSGAALKLAVIDYGITKPLLNNIIKQDLEVRIFPADTSFAVLKSFNPDGVFLSTGPGNPELTKEYALPVIKELLENGIPLFGMGLGHQLLALALGAKTIKMPVGHHGTNHPVKDLTSGKVQISSHNHGYAVDKDSLPEDIEITHISLFDGTVEGLASLKYPAFSVQYDQGDVFIDKDYRYNLQEFMELMKNAKKN